MEAETCKRELVIEIPVDVVRHEADSIAAQYARVARIPGFRPGHAPRTLIRQRFREDIRNEVVQSLLPKFFQDAVKAQNWAVVGRPEFEDLTFEDDRPLTCKARFEVYPEFELGEYRGLEVEEDLPTVSEEDVGRALEEIRQKAATFEPVADRGAEDGDYVLVNYRGQDVKDPETRPVEARDALVHVGGKGTVPAFSENLRGAKAGETREFEVAYPDDYPQKSLAGKTFGYRVEVVSVKRKVLPPVSDELAKSVSEFATLEELSAKLRERLKEQREHEVQAAAKRKLLEQLLAQHTFPLPRALVESQLNGKLERLLARLMADGIDPRSAAVDWGKVREEARPDAEREVRVALLLEKVAEREKLEASEEETDTLIRELAAESRETPAALKTRLTRDGGLEKIKSTRRGQKALDFIYSNAKIKRNNPSNAETGVNPARS